MADSPKIKFFFPRKTSLTQRGPLKVFIEKLLRREGKSLSGLNYVFCSDRELLKINQQYLSHQDFTDIITFDLSEPGSGITGEIYISVDRVRDNALQLGESFRKELHRVIFHGALHLAGYKDKSPQDQHKMREKEEFYLARYL